MTRPVGVAEMAVSADPDEILVTHALGSCLGITVYDPEARVGGLLHAMLPLSSTDPEKARRTPAMFVDTGIPRLFLDCYALGARKDRAAVVAAGGATHRDAETDDFFEIGKRNAVILRKLLWKNAVVLKSSDLGGCSSRTMSLRISDGTVTILSGSVETVLWCPRRAAAAAGGGG